MSSKVQPLHRRVLAVSSGAFVVVFVGGFGVMSWFWSRSDQSVERGFTYFISATWGDALFLPLLVAGAIGYSILNPTESLSRRTRLWSRGMNWTFGMAGALVGLAIQASWLINADTVLNWTIPEPHAFNAAGYYHALFFIVMMGAIPLLLSSVLLRKSVAERQGLQSPPYSDLSYTILWFGGSGYLFMRLAENETIKFDNPYAAGLAVSVMTATGCAFAILPSVIRFLTKKSGPAIRQILSKDLRLTLAGILLAYGVSVSVIGIDATNHQNVASFASALALYCLGLLFPVAQPLNRTIIVSIILVSTGLGLGSLVAVTSDLHSQVLVVVLAALVIFFMSGYQHETRFYKQAEVRDEHRYFEEFLLILPVLACGVITQEKTRNDIASRIGAEASSQLFDVIIYTILLGTTIWVLTTLFVRCAVRGDSSLDLEQRIQVQDAKNTMWIAISGIFIGLVVLLLINFVTTQQANSRVSLPSFGVGSLLFGALLITILFHCAKHRESQAWKLTTLIGVTLLYSVTVLCIGGLRLPLVYNWWELFLIGPIIGTSLFIANGLVGNLCLLRGTPPDKWNIALAGIIFFGCVAVFVFSVVPTYSGGQRYLASLTSPAIGLIGCLFGATVPALLGAHVLYISTPKRGILESSGLRGLLQDTLMAAVVVISAG